VDSAQHPARREDAGKKAPQRWRNIRDSPERRALTSPRPDKWVKTRQPVDWFYYSAKATGNYNKGAEMKQEPNNLRSCPNCGNTIKRRPSESWPSYAKRTACSLKCAAIIRNAKERERRAKERDSNTKESDSENAVLALEMAIKKWRVA
jgi:endogenous inhibitor of DNA gyrase (YacG/DUF329 family)